MSAHRSVTQNVGLPVEQAGRLPHLVSHHTIVRRPALAVAGLAALAAVACLPAPMPATASRAAGFPTGDPPQQALPADHFDIDIDIPREPPLDIIEGCFGPFDALLP